MTLVNNMPLENNKTLVNNFYKIEHKICNGFNGIAMAKTTILPDEYSVAVFWGPNELKNNSTALEVKLKITSVRKSKSEISSMEGHFNSVVENILLDFIDFSETNKTISLNVHTNSFNLEMILNSVLIAAVDGGIPLKQLFCTFKDGQDLFIGSSENMKFITKLKDEYPVTDVKEILYDSVRDMQ